MNQTENVNTSWFISIQQFLKYCLIIILFNRINVNQFAKFQCVLSVYLTRSYVRQHTFIWFFIYLFIFITFSSHIIFNLTNKYKILSVLPYAGSSIFLKKYFFKKDFIVPLSFWGILFTLIIISHTCILSILISTIPS